MPSVRVRSTYAPIGDQPLPQSCVASFAADRPSLPTQPLLQSSLQNSKIHSHIADSQERAASLASVLRATYPESNGRWVTPPSHHLGGRTDNVVRARADTQPGLIGDAFDSPHGTSQRGGDLDHHDEIVEHLDVIDPQVGTVSTLTNAANGILVPPLSWYPQKPVVTLSYPPKMAISDPERCPGEHSLDRHVEAVLNKPSKFRRTMKGVWAFLKTPLGVLTGIYCFCVVFWGAAIVIFLLKIIDFHNANTQAFWVEVSSQIENGLFTVTGIGLIPFRVLDTYRIYWIWHYKRRTQMLRAEAGLPGLFNADDLPDPSYDPNYVPVLTDKEQNDLHRQQVKFQQRQTWYRAHGTETHRAFPINTALLICCLNDGNSIFQIILCGTMWGLDRFHRPAWSTGILIPASFLCGILSAVFIAIGGNHTKRTDKVEERLRAALAMQHPVAGRSTSDAATYPESLQAEKLGNGQSGFKQTSSDDGWGQRINY